LQLGVAPNGRVLAQQLGQTDLQGTVEHGDLPFLLRAEGFVVNVGKADEYIVLKGSVSHVFT
jgi:hypothetical protein